jgi:tRNA(fMet)-specific endonuclease VapC
VSHLLDTNVVVALLKNRPVQVRERYREAQATGTDLAISAVVLFELWYGVAKSSRQPENTERLRVFLSGAPAVVVFDGEDARVAGQVRAGLEQGGEPIGAYDLLIAGQALHRGLTVVTANTGEFSRVPGLAWVDWTGR